MMKIAAGLHLLIPVRLFFLTAQQDESLSSGKSAKMPAAGPGPRGTRISAKMAAYGTQDAGSAPHAQGLCFGLAFLVLVSVGGLMC